MTVAASDDAISCYGAWCFLVQCGISPAFGAALHIVGMKRGGHA
jgi:hypothetical protein